MMEFRVWSLWEQMWTAKRCSDDSKIFFIFGNLFLVMADIHLFLFYPTGSQNNGKHKWEEAEVLAVERQMMRLIQGHKVPQKNDCIQCLEAEPEALRNRSWKGVKDYVRNRITALKRQSGASRATSTNSNLPGQVEPQQSTGHFQQFWTWYFVGDKICLCNFAFPPFLSFTFIYVSDATLWEFPSIRMKNRLIFHLCFF